MLRIEDRLVSPLNTPLQYAVVTIRALHTEPVFKETVGTVSTDADGVLEFDLIKGDYRVYLTQVETKVMQPIGYINSSVFDTAVSPVTLGSILTEQLESEVPNEA